MLENEFAVSYDEPPRSKRAKIAAAVIPSVQDPSPVKEAGSAGCAPDISMVSDSSGGDVVQVEEEEDMVVEIKSLREAKQKLSEYATSRPTLVQLTGDYTAKQFLRMFFPKHRKAYRWSKQRLLFGKVQMFELPNHGHEAVAGSISYQLARQSRCLKSGGSGDICVHNSILQPDGSLFMAYRNVHGNLVCPGAVDSNNFRFPKVVLEVAFSEAYSSIFSLPEVYFGVAEAVKEQDSADGVRGVMIVIVRRGQAQAQAEGQARREYQMVALYYDYTRRHDHPDHRPEPSWSISFGDYLHPSTKAVIEGHGRVPAGQMRGVGANDEDPLCSGLDMPAYQFDIPGEALLHGIGAEDRVIMNNPLSFSVDLFELKQDILESCVNKMQ